MIRASAFTSRIIFSIAAICIVSETIAQSNKIDGLRAALFPENRSHDFRVSFRQCITVHDSLILYMRKNQPDIDRSIAILKEITLRQDKDLMTELVSVASRHVNNFKREWECALRQFPLCNATKEQLRLLHALETAIKVYKFDKIYPTVAGKYEYWRRASDLFYISLWKQNKRFEEYLDDQANDSINSIAWDDINNERENLIWGIPYYKNLQLEKNTFDGIFLDWSYVTPFFNDMKRLYLEDLHSFREKEPSNSLSYMLEKSFFNHFSKAVSSEFIPEK